MWKSWKKIKCYNCKQIDHYANKCTKSLKNKFLFWLFLCWQLGLIITKTSLLSAVRVLYIHYLLRFKKNASYVQILLYLSNEINVITLIYPSQIDIWVYSNEIRAQNIDASTLQTLKIILASFQVRNKLEKV